MINPLELTGKHILLVGASSGIGRACGLLFAELGAQLSIVGRNKDKLEVTLGELTGTGHASFPCDVSKIETLEALFVEICGRNKLSGIVYAAGVGPILPLPVLTDENAKSFMDTNFYPFLAMLRLFSKKKYAGQGSCVAISSVSSIAGWPGGIGYCASKGALDAAVRAAAIELAPRGIRVNTVMPSNIDTPMYRSNSGEYQDEEATARILAKQPLGLGRPEDVAHAAAFLIGDASRFITGSHLVVDGGYLAQ